MWAEAMGKLEGMESSKRERLWPQLVHGFKDLSQRLKVDIIHIVRGNAVSIYDQKMCFSYIAFITIAYIDISYQEI